MCVNKPGLSCIRNKQLHLFKRVTFSIR